MPVLDNHDSRIRYVELLMQRDDLKDIPAFDLPEGYRFVFYRPGDRDAWIEIEHSAKELAGYEHGVRTWERFFGHVEHTLHNRMLFIENEKGEKVATATAYYDEHGDLPAECGQVHWVAVRRDHQGKGLAKPLIMQVLRVMKERGHERAVLHTQTTSWVAVRLYLNFGFYPMPENAVRNRDGWRIVKALTDHPALEAFDKADWQLILTPEAYAEAAQQENLR